MLRSIVPESTRTMYGTVFPSIVVVFTRSAGLARFLSVSGLKVLSEAGRNIRSFERPCNLHRGLAGRIRPCGIIRCQMRA
jgi:hypothetical protein